MREPSVAFFELRSWFGLKLYTADSIKVVPKQREKIEYERESLQGETIKIHKPNKIYSLRIPCHYLYS